GVFAIAMTLLVLELHVPDVASTGDFISGLAALVPRLFSFTLSFAVLGAYWLGTVWSLAPVRHVDRPLRLLNRRGLLFITLVRFVAAMAVAPVSPRAGYAVYYIVLFAYIFTAARDRSVIGD